DRFVSKQSHRARRQYLLVRRALRRTGKDVGGFEGFEQEGGRIGALRAAEVLESRVAGIVNLAVVDRALPEILLVRGEVFDQPLAILLAAIAVDAVLVPIIRLHPEKDA